MPALAIGQRNTVQLEPELNQLGQLAAILGARGPIGIADALLPATGVSLVDEASTLQSGAVRRLSALSLD